MADTTLPLNGYSNSTESIAENRQKYAKYFKSGSNDEMSMETFYSLLTAEMSNQDPMEPMSNTEFISQMASFTSLKSQQDSLYYSNANYAQSLVGKTVTVASMAGSTLKSDTGVVTSMNLTNGEFNVKVNGKAYSLSSIMEVVTGSNPYQITSNDGAYATSLIGKNVTVSSTTSSGQVVDSGIVQRIEIKDNAITVIINDIAFPLSDVVKVENAKATTDTTNNTNTTDKTDTTDTDGNIVVDGGDTVETEPYEADNSDTVTPTDDGDYPDLIPDDENDEEELKALFDD